MIMELNPSGQLIWAKNIGGIKSDNANAIVKDCANIYITGSYRDKVDIDPSTDTVFLALSDSIRGKAFISKFSLIPASPTLVQASKDSICKGEALTLTVSGNFLADGTNWQWHEGSCGGPVIGTGETITVLPSSSGDYFVRSESSCSYSECMLVSVNVKESPDASASLITQADCSGVFVNCKNESINADSYVWNFNDGSGSVLVNSEHYYTYNSDFQIFLTAINNNGCKDTLSIKENSSAPDWFQLVIPNVFTPNNDGVNDELKISSNASINNCFSLKIFNRWGNEVYSTNNMDTGWNGVVSNGQKSEPGTYFYVLKVDEFEYKGSVLLLE
jgi:gliding motility-associated-like protein